MAVRSVWMKAGMDAGGATDGSGMGGDGASGIGKSGGVRYGCGCGWREERGFPGSWILSVGGRKGVRWRALNTVQSGAMLREGGVISWVPPVVLQQWVMHPEGRFNELRCESRCPWPWS